MYVSMYNRSLFVETIPYCANIIWYNVRTIVQVSLLLVLFPCVHENLSVYFDARRFTAQHSQSPQQSHLPLVELPALTPFRILFRMQIVNALEKLISI